MSLTTYLVQEIVTVIQNINEPTRWLSVQVQHILCKAMSTEDPADEKTILETPSISDKN